MAETPIFRALRPNEPKGPMGRRIYNSTVQIRRFINKNRPLLYGTLLGDACISNRGHKSRIQVLHSEKEKDYLFHLYGLFQDCTTAPPRCKEKWSPNTPYPVWYFFTKHSAEFQRLWSIFHENSPAIIQETKRGPRRMCRKVVTPEILSTLNDHGLALWIMDDGCCSLAKHTGTGRLQRRFTLCTDSYTHEENRLIQSWFLERYGAQSHLDKQKRANSHGEMKVHFRIVMGCNQYDKVVSKIESYIIPSMRHKIEGRPLQDKGDLSNGKVMKRSELHGDMQSQSETAGRLAEARS